MGGSNLEVCSQVSSLAVSFRKSTSFKSSFRKASDLRKAISLPTSEIDFKGEPVHIHCVSPAAVEDRKGSWEVGGVMDGKDRPEREESVSFGLLD